jgi:ribosomal protein S18 acetylase RimI-like enzyme
MDSASEEFELIPLDHDPGAASGFGREAAIAYSLGCDPPQDPELALSHMAETIGNGTAHGRLVAAGGSPVGLVLWDRATQAHLVLGALFLDAAHRSESGYRRLLELLGRLAPVRLVPAPLPGLDAEAEGRVMGALGFGRFGRSEMRRLAEAPLPDAAAPSGVFLRPARTGDEPAFVAILRAAFREHFDRYMFQVDPDYDADTSRAVREILGGQYGEFLPWASWVAEQGTNAVGALLVVRAPTGPLIIEVAVLPSAQGRGIAAALVVAGVRALHEHGEAPPFLNVTDGNDVAIRLYRRLGFVRTVTGWSWYARDQIPVGPDGQPTTPSPASDASSRSSTTGSTGNGTRAP